MCGIIGISGKGKVKSLLVDGLSALEYRGYDSAGVAFGGENIDVYKCGERVGALAKMIPHSADGNVGIGHTRWATHGEVCAKNAHPHLSPNGEFAIVHNGVVENCDELKEILLSSGESFSSDTDSEIIAHLLENNYRGDMLSAVKDTADMLVGSATFLAIKKGDDKVYCHKRGTALVVGENDFGGYASSDALALQNYCESECVLSDGDIAIVGANGVQIYRNGKAVECEKIPFFQKPPAKCDCHMKSEIEEIPTALKNTFLTPIPDDCVLKIRQSERIAIFACGTAYHAGLYGKYVFEKIAGIPTDVYVASESDDVGFLSPAVFAIFISQSGETADTLQALKKLKTLGLPTLAITNVPLSTITFGADYTIITGAGAEIAVAATKSYNCQLLSLYLLSSKVAERNNACAVKGMIASARGMVKSTKINENATAKKLFFIGKGADGITAKEGALKFKEITYKMTDAYPSGELKHGAIALIDESALVVVIATNVADKERTQATIKELKTRKATVVTLSALGDLGGDETIHLPPIDDEILYPILAIIPLQKLALETSLSLGINPDKPRNLAKSVTVI